MMVMMNSVAERGLLSVEQLNLLGDSTGDYYLCYDYGTGLVTFSNNVLGRFDVFAGGEARCSLDEWHEMIDPIDRPRHKGMMEELLSNPGQTYNLNYRVRDRQGRRVWVSSRGRSYAGSAGGAAYLVGRISTQFDMAGGSALTRNFSRDELKEELERICEGERRGCLVLAGVDDLRVINTKSGWKFGDAVIQSLVRGMTRLMPGADKVYRIDGDEFAAIMPEADEAEAARAFGELQEYLRGQCTVSGGCVLLERYSAPDADTLVQYAETALEAAKLAGKNRLNLFSPEDYEKKLRGAELREEMRAAIGAGFKGFDIAYQAQVRSESYELFGAEALLRFDSPRYGPVSTAEFVPVLEQSELIYPVGLWVLDKALEQCLKWRRELPDFHMSINMSYTQLASANIEEDVLRLVRSSGVPGSALTVELTESMQLLNYPHLNDIIRAWKREGIEISVDDFGTGYSNLSRLHEMDIDEIKIDRCFVSGIERSAYNYRLLSNMVELADSCQMRICCEGVETVEELSALETLHPTVYQGFLFARPERGDAFGAHMREWNALIERGGIASLREDALAQTDAGSSDVMCANAILDAADDIYYLSDPDTYEMYYLNRAGRKLFNARDVQGRKCYKVLHGRDAPCEFCTNSRIRRNSFYIWEHQNSYCDRRFLLRDKLVLYNGKQVHLEVATDITRRERLSQATSERLNFASKVVGELQALCAQCDFDSAARQALDAAGAYYQADRAYLFERDAHDPAVWHNAFERCADGVPSRRADFRQLSSDALELWIKQFSQNRSVMLFNLDALKQLSPLDWQSIIARGVFSLIATPILDGERIAGFVCVENPRYSLSDDSQLRVLASFLITRMRQNISEDRYRELLRDGGPDVRGALDMGFWSMHVSARGARPIMTCDSVLRRMLDMEGAPEDADCFDALRSRVRADELARFDAAIMQMERLSEVVTLHIRWRHPARGEVTLCLAGVRFGEAEGSAWLRGYCRALPRETGET